MRITELHIYHFKSIREIHLTEIENVLILVGQNSSGKTCILDAIRAVMGNYVIAPEDFNEKRQKIEIEAEIELDEESLQSLHARKIVSGYKRYEKWLADFGNKLPSWKDGRLRFTFQASPDGDIRYFDGVHKNNRYICQLLPEVFYLDSQRDIRQMQETILMFQEDDLLKRMRTGCCMFDSGKPCSHCFSCMGLIERKRPDEMNAFEAEKLLEYKLYQMNLDGFSRRVNRIFRRNSGRQEEICYELQCHANQIFQVETTVYNPNREYGMAVDQMGKGMRSIYILSLLEACMEEEGKLPGLIVVEDPEIFLHPRLQKISGEILFRLSKKSQVIFSTHSPNLLSHFNRRQIRQVVLDEEDYSVIREKTDISEILDDLGYTANDLLNVNFVFFVEGKQDKSRLPLLLEKYYSEICDEQGNLSRVAIITTNSCTNIKTYANLKYMNQVYIQDQFLMIRDGDGKDPEELIRSLCKYYDERRMEDVDRLPRVRPRNVLILKYYSFENYFLNPELMTKIGVLKYPEDFYRILWEKWQEYLHRLSSGRHLTQVMGREFIGPEDMKEHMEEIRIYLRGHNLFDIFYGKYKEKEQDLLKQYVELAPREEFKDILDGIDRFIYFYNRKME